MNASAGRSSGVRSGRGGASRIPAAATPRASCIPAMETGRKNACAASPANANAAAVLERSKVRLHTTVRADAAAGPSSAPGDRHPARSEEHTSELQSQSNLVCRLLLEKKKRTQSSP